MKGKILVFTYNYFYLITAFISERDKQLTINDLADLDLEENWTLLNNTFIKIQNALKLSISIKMLDFLIAYIFATLGGCVFQHAAP